MASGLSVLLLTSRAVGRLGLPLMLAVALKAPAAVVQGEVRDADGAPIQGAVVSLTPKNPRSVDRVHAPRTAVVDQSGREFLPHVLPIAVGADVKFPNSDRIHHHVYSFSPARRFEIKLYKGTPAEPIRFDQVGVVVLGCNIHDWMVGYVFVTAAPYFAATDAAGAWTLDVPAGDYTVDLWHPDVDLARTPDARSSAVVGSRPVNLSQALALKRQRRSGKPPATRQEEGYSGEP